MTKAERINELMGAMQSFGKDKYYRSELLPEMFALQREIVELTFNGVHASTADLKIWDVEKHLEQMNQNCGNVADEALKVFMDESKTFCNLIKAEVSGTRGEVKAFRTLEYLKNRNLILKNVELNDGKQRTELDAVVITPEVVTIVEVKNTAKNIFIDEKGDYFRTGEYLRWDCNIAEKMQVKEELLRRALECGGIQNIRIEKVVVFTDSRIEVQNKYSPIRTCFASQLAYIIDGLKGERVMTDEEMNEVEKTIKASEVKESYPFEFDVAQYKRDFATLMATLEDAASFNETADLDGVEFEEKEANVWMLIKDLLKSKYAGYACSAIAGAALTFVSTVAISSIKKGGILR